MQKDSPLLREENVAALKLYMSGKSEADVGKELGISRSGAKDRLNKYRDAGILVGSFNRGSKPTCHWAKLDLVPDVTTPVPSGIKPVPEPKKRNALTDAEIVELKQFLKDRREQSESDIKLIQRGDKHVRNFRLCDGLWAEVVSRAEQDNLKLTDIIERALRNYLKVDYE